MSILGIVQMFRTHVLSVSDRDNCNGPCLVTASPGNSPDIDSLNRLIESEFHTRGLAGVKTVCV